LRASRRWVYGSDDRAAHVRNYINNLYRDTPMDARKNVVSWLRGAHASGRLKNYPVFEASVKQHITESQGQAETLRRRLESLGTDVSTTKAGAAWLGGNSRAIFGSVA